MPGTDATYVGRRRKGGVVGHLFVEGKDNAPERVGTEPGNERMKFVALGEHAHDQGWPVARII